MASLFSDNEKNAIESMLNDVHDTFKKSIYVYIEEVTSIDFSDTQFNPIYGRSFNQAKTSKDKKLTKHTVEARVFYDSQKDNEFIEDIGAGSSENIIRIKVNYDAKELIKNASVIEVDDERYSLISDAEAIGPFSNTYWKIYLKRDG
jgi:hypothetical protein